MNCEEKINELEKQLQAEEVKIKALFQGGRIPGPDDYAEADRLKRELKTARRVRAMEARRVDPKLTRKVSFLLPEAVFDTLTKKANAAGYGDLSKYIRDLLTKLP